MGSACSMVDDGVRVRGRLNVSYAPTGRAHTSSSPPALHKSRASTPPLSFSDPRGQGQVLTSSAAVAVAVASDKCPRITRRARGGGGSAIVTACPCDGVVY